MESSNDTKIGHSMEHHLTDHQVPLSLVCLISLLFGVPLAWNMLWHLRVANGGSGDRNKKGVLQLILQKQHLNMLCVPVICIDLLILAWPSQQMPFPVCVFLECAALCVWNNHFLGSLSIALGR